MKRLIGGSHRLLYRFASSQMENGRIIFNRRWSVAEEELKEACIRNKINPDRESYQKAVNRGWKHAVNAILDGTFVEEEWLETPKQRYQKCIKIFRNFLRDYNIRPQTYRRRYGHKIKDGAWLIYLGQELDIEYWTNKKSLPSKQEAYEIISRLCEAEGYAISEYQLKTRRYLKNFRRYIQANGINRPDIIRRNWLSLSKDPARDPENIEKHATSMVGPGRTHGLSQLDFGNRFKSVVKCFYPDGLRGLNSALKLNQVEKLPNGLRDAPSHGLKLVETRIERLENKIKTIHRSLDPEYLKSLADDLKRLSAFQEISSSNRPEEDALGKTKSEQNDFDIEQVLINRIKCALLLPEGFLYFKRWSMSDRIWFKIGITNDPSRRDKEQNVLPVPSETLNVIRLKSMEQARAVEKAIHYTLSPMLVKGAKNKELFELTGNEYRALDRALRELERLCDTP